MIDTCPHCGTPFLAHGPAAVSGMSDTTGRGRRWFISDGRRLVHMCAIDDARHLSARMQDGGFAAEVTSLLRALEGAISVDEVAQLIAGRTARLFDAVYSNLAIIDGPTLRIAHHDSLAAEIATKYRVVPLDDSTPLGTAALTREPVLLPSLAHYEPRYAHMIDDTRRSGISATVSFPVCDPEPTAVIGLAWAHWTDSLRSETLAVVESVARSCAYALRAARTQTKH